MDNNNQYFIVRDWLVSETHVFDDINKAQEKYDEILKHSQGGDCDIELCIVLREFNNIK